MNLTNLTINNYIDTSSFGTTSINATGIIRDICQFKYDYIYQGGSFYLMLLTLIFIGILLVNKILSISEEVHFKKKYCGLGKRGFYINYLMMNIEIEKSVKNNLVMDLISLLIPRKIAFINDDLKIILLYVFVMRNVFVYFAYHDTFPFTNIRGF